MTEQDLTIQGHRHRLRSPLGELPGGGQLQKGRLMTMYILTSDGKSIVDSSFVERFCIVEKPDACLVVASYSADRAVTIGRYADRKEADSAFSSLLNSLVGNSNTYAFTMLDSVLYHGEKWKRDARTTRKGGS